MSELLALDATIGFGIVIVISVLLAIAIVFLAFAIRKELKKNAKAPVLVRKETKNTPFDNEILAANEDFYNKEEVKEEPKPEAVKEEIIEEEKAPAPVIEEKKETPVAPVEEKPVKKATSAQEKKPTKAVVAQDKKEAPVKKKAVKEIPAKKNEPEVVASEDDKKSKVSGKFELCNSNLGGYNYILRANNGQLLYESKTYKSLASCEDGVHAFSEAVKVGMFSIRADKFQRYKFILKSPTSNNIIYVGESFDNERSCQSNIESVRRFAEISDIVDNTDADFKAEFTPYVISDEVKEKVADNNGVVGKWSIEQEGSGKYAPYVFLLYANNGQLLYESRDYSNYNSCKNGLETFKKTVKEGEFVIDPDKSGRFKFILRNTKSNSLMEYIGQNYSTKSACAEGIDSIYRFALVSPTDKL